MTENNISMTEMQNIIQQIVVVLKEFCPIDKRNLITHIDLDTSDPDTILIKIGDPIGAPYAHSTNDPWDPPVDIYYHKNRKPRTPNNQRNLKSFEHGGMNPNEGWVERAINHALSSLAQEYLGVVITNV